VASPRFSQRLTGSARDGYERAIDVLERLVPLARAIRGGVLAYAVLVGLAGLVIAGVILWADAPSTAWTWLAFVVLVGFLLAPSAVLVSFALVLGESLKLPDKLRRLPDVAPQRANELAELVAEARLRERTLSLRSLPGDSWRAGRLLISLRDDVPWAGALLHLARIPYLILVAAAFAVGFVQVLLAPVFVFYALLISAL
jgi:hypothetical protein